MSSLLFSAAAHAGPLLPCLTATQSADGNVLVTDTLSFDDPDENQTRNIVSSVFQVYQRYSDLNEGLRLNGPNAYWADPFWKVEFKRDAKSSPEACSYVLVPNDGEYLVFVGSTFTSVAVTIYHHRAYDPSLGRFVSQQGVLVRHIRLSDLFPSDPPVDIITDHTPLWFAGGTFKFSLDQKKLNYQDKIGRRVEIGLANGEIKHVK